MEKKKVLTYNGLKRVVYNVKNTNTTTANSITINFNEDAYVAQWFNLMWDIKIIDFRTTDAIKDIYISDGDQLIRKNIKDIITDEDTLYYDRLFSFEIERIQNGNIATLTFKYNNIKN